MSQSQRERSERISIGPREINKLYFQRAGEALRSLRRRVGSSLEEWALTLAIPSSTLSRIENGKGQTPIRPVLESWMDKLGLNEEERDNLMMDMGYFPSLTYHELTRADKEILRAAVRELIRPDAPKGFIEIAKQRLEKLRQTP